jgi:2-methylcitrate dehydratase PrpD
VPAALSLGEREGVDGRRLIAALAAGYDVAGRIDRAAEPGRHFAHSFHPSAVFGHFGAAATSASLLGLDAARTENALGLAGMTAGGLAVWIQAEREDSRPFVIGMAAHRGVLAALLAGLGMGGPRGIADDGKYTIYDAFTGAMHLDELDRDLGERFLIAEHSGFKRYPCCGGGGIHASIAAVLQLVDEHGLDAAEIDAIVDRVTPETGVGVPLKSHSTEYLLAVAAARRQIAPDAIVVDYRSRDPEVARLYRRVEIVPDAALAARSPGAAVVELRLRGGRVLRAEVHHRPGSPADPLPPEEIDAKFLRYATTRLPRAQAVRVRDLVARLEELPDVRELAGLLAVPGS